MSNPETFLAQCVTLPTFAKMHGRAHQWAYDMVELGLPIIDIKGMNKLVHIPTADAWFADRLRSRGRKIRPIKAA